MGPTAMMMNETVSSGSPCASAYDKSCVLLCDLPHDISHDLRCGEARGRSRGESCDESYGGLSEESCAQTRDRTFDQVVVEYWDERSDTYSNGIWDELQDAHAQAWRAVLVEKLSADCGSSQPGGRAGESASSLVGGQPEEGVQTLAGLKVLDLGCGPGFFEILLSQLGCHVHAMDASTQMLARAQANVATAGAPERVEFFCGDVAQLPFVSDVYDVVISRNVTWLMKNPAAAYAEWQRVLKPGGKLLVFDANWYAYLADEALDRARLCDQVDPSILDWGDRSFASTAQERRCEAIARELPHTYHARPAWDLEVLPHLGFDQVNADESVFRRVWNEGEQAFYATSPLFAVEAVKAR